MSKSHRTASHSSAMSALKKALPTSKDSALLKRFCDLYLYDTPAEEINNLLAKKLADNVVAAFRFFGACKKNVHVRVFNAPYSKHSIVEVVMPDQPFLVDSTWNALHKRGYEVHHTFHPVLAVQRTPAGNLKNLSAVKHGTPAKKDFEKESLIHIEFDREDDKGALRALEKDITHILTQAQHVTKDFTKMTERLAHARSACLTKKTHGEENAFVDWLLDGNFIFLGYRHYLINRKNKAPTLGITPKSGLGILRSDKESSVAKNTPLTKLPKNFEVYYNSKEPLILTKTLHKSPIHRAVDMEYVGIKEFDSKGRVIGEHRFVGLFTSHAYTTSARDIPIVRQKIAHVLEREQHHSSNSHNYKALVSILENYPRDELFQTGVDDLHRISTGILHLSERQHTRLFVRQSPHDRIVTAMIYLPRDRMSSTLREKFCKLLMDTYHGEDIEFKTRLGDSRLARLFFKIRTKSDTPINVCEADIEQIVKNMSRSWEGDLINALIEQYGETRGRALGRKYADAFRAGYKENTPTHLAVDDIAYLEEIDTTDCRFTTSVNTSASGTVHLKVFHQGAKINLSDIMPLFNDLGLHVSDENPTCVKGDLNSPIWIHDFAVTPSAGQEKISTPETIAILKEAIAKAWKGDLESDNLNRLIVGAGMHIRDIVILRALLAYMQQIGVRYSKNYMRDTLTKHAALAAQLTTYFDTRFAPTYAKREGAMKRVKTNIESALKDVSVLDEDIIIRTLLGIIDATVRTNAWQRTSATEPLAFKLESTRVPGLPKPHPLYEIFVYHASVEGVHLRGGMVARGGLRWSDRPADFRTEVLGLMKTQMTKNAVIVPVGSKGGFVLKTPPCDLKAPDTCEREALFNAVRGAYSTFVRALISVTDNIQNGKVVPPLSVHRHDGDDPYLVVAADKGTATFSDTANALSLNARNWKGNTTGFWLGDAFASGGSNGYDHKKMGITARGAWECVKQHFREMGKDIQHEDFSVAAIGDMAGDVFGNGMLLSKHIQLKAAFNHMHIFLDPTPHAAKTWEERKRLFDDVKGWDAYNTKLISKGGGIYKRSEKSITLSKEAKDMLGLSTSTPTPNEIIRAILQMDVELLWNGGIGTYIKASSENHLDVGDRANDDVRINGKELRCGVVGEGGNLGFTQLARIEYALNGGRINTDAIDNSAGVDCSDHEVNIKILLNLAQETTKLTEKARNKLLEDMTDDVAKHVLKDNYQQAGILSIAQKVSREQLDTQDRLIKSLVKKKLLDPRIEFLPDEEEIERRKKDGIGLTRPELAILLAYAKFDVYQTLLETNLPDDKALASYLYEYFPRPLQKKYLSLMENHRLKREIVATVATNELINRMGLTFLDRMRDETGHDEATITRAFLISKALFDADEWWRMVESLDNKVPAQTQMDMYDTIKQLLEATAFWFLRHGTMPLDIDTTVNHFHGHVFELVDSMQQHLTGPMKKRHEEHLRAWKEKGLTGQMATLFSLMPKFHCAPGVASIALKTGQPVQAIMDLHFSIGETMHMDMLHERVRSIPVENNWQRVASLSIVEDLYTYQSEITCQAIDMGLNKDAPTQAMARWVDKKNGGLTRYMHLIDEVCDQPQSSHAMMNVVLGQIKGLIG